MLKKPFCILLIISVFLLGTSLAQEASKPRLVGNFTRKGLGDGCGCYFRFRGAGRDSEQYIFAEPVDDEKIAWMNIGGRNVRLKLVKEQSAGDRERVGSRWTRTFVSNDITVTSTYVATRVCAPEDESCESTDYTATFVVRKGKLAQTVKALGYCGC
ncbi:MAG: hypothetical protein ACR2LM_07985 [Pyrinomonadaceae bacterium]